MLYGPVQQAVRFDKDVGRGACGRESTGMHGGWARRRGPGTPWNKRDWARPLDITSCTWEGEKHATCTEATSCAL